MLTRVLIQGIPFRPLSFWSLHFDIIISVADAFYQNCPNLRSRRIKGGGREGGNREKKKGGKMERSVGGEGTGKEEGAPSFPQFPPPFFSAFFFSRFLPSLPPLFMRLLRRLELPILWTTVVDNYPCKTEWCYWEQMTTSWVYIEEFNIKLEIIKYFIFKVFLH